jgi:nitrate reductase gamma subunit
MFLQMDFGSIFILALMGAFLVYFVRRIVTGRSRQTTTKDWLLYFLIAPLAIAALIVCFFYAERKGIDEETTVKWMNIFLSAVFVFGVALEKLWDYRRKWTFWTELGVLIAAHFTLLSRLH